MGNAHARGRRLVPAVVVAALLAVAVLVALGALARPAAAQSTFEPTCAACHTMSSVHGNVSHAGFVSACATCHNDGGTANPPLPSACGACHGGVEAILGKTTHTGIGCGTTDGCHGYTSPTPTPSPTPSATRVTTTMTLKVSPSIQRVRRTVRFTGSAGPVAALAGAKVSLKVQRKVGTRWVTMKTATRVVGSTGKFSWSYRTAKRGTHHITASVKGTAAHTAKKLVKTFKVK